MKYGEVETEFLKKAIESGIANYTVTCTGRVAAVSDIPLTDAELKNLGIGRTDAFGNVNYVCIDKVSVNAIADILEGMDDSNWTPVQKEAVEVLFDAVNGIQYQTMIKWIENYRKNNMKKDRQSKAL